MAEAKQTTGRGNKFTVDGAIFAITDVDQLRLALAQHFGHGAEVIAQDFDEELLHWFERALFRLLVDHFGRADGKFGAFAAHRLDQHRQVQLTTTGDDKFTGQRGLFHAHRDVVLQLRHQASAQLATGEVGAITASKGAVVDTKGHAHCRLFHLDRRQRARVGGRSQCVTDAHVGDTGDGDDIAGVDLILLLPLQVAEAVDLADLGHHHFAFGVDVRDLLA